MVRRLVHALIIVLTLVVGAAAAAVIVSQTAWFKDWLRGYIERQANQYLNGQFSIQRLGGNLFFGIELENVGVSMDGSQIVAVKDLGLDYNVFQLIASGLSVDNIRLNQPVLYLRRDGDTWSIGRLLKRERSEADRQGPARSIAIDDIGVTDGSVVIDGAVGTSGVELPKRFDRLDAKLSFRYEPVRYSVEIANVSFRGSDPAIALNALSGGVSVRNDTVFVDQLAVRTAETSLTLDGAVEQYLTRPIFKVQLTSDKFSLPEFAPLVPSLSGISLQPAFELKLNGPIDGLGVDMNVRSSAGQVTGNVIADLMTPGRSVNGTISVRHLDLASVLKNPKQRSDITGDAQIDVRFASLADLDSLDGSITLHAPRVAAAGYTAEAVEAKATFDGRRVGIDAKGSAYGATATAAGRVTLPATADTARNEPLAFDLRGETRNVDLRRMPRNFKIPPAATNLNATYHMVGAVPSGAGRRDVRGEARLRRSTIAGAAIADGSRATFSMRGNDIAYSADATLSSLDLQRVGEQFNVPALATDRYASSIDGHIVANGKGTTRQNLELTARGSVADSSILGGWIPQLAFDATVGHDAAHVKANGSFADFDPAVITGKPAAHGHVGGTLDLDVTLAHVSRGVAADTLQAAGRVDLEPSKIGELEITRANIVGDYRDSTGVIRALDIVGPDLNVNATGTLALNDTGESNLTVHADSLRLDEIGRMVDRPIAGIGKVDATVTGNRRELQATGNFTGGGVKYGNNGALGLSSDFTAIVSDLDAANTRVSAVTHGTLVSIAGQDVNELTAKTEYAGKQLTFDATATQPRRSLQTAGTVVLHPDHQEVHLQRLALQSQGVAWTTAPGSQAAIQYARDAVTVKDLHLVNGAQEISADGTFGRPGQAMAVTLNNIDLATVDALLLRPPRFSGRMTASARVSGTKSAPSVEGDFSVAQGGFRQFQYDTFTGTFDYSRTGVTLDARLQQNPTTWLTAKGYVPATLFKPAAARSGEAAGHGAAAAPEDRIDLRVDSSPIDLGIVQGLTTAVSNVTGTLEAHVQITGSGADPHPTGEVAVQNGAFTVDQTGVGYTRLNGVVDLQPDRVHITNLVVLDNHQSALSVTGDLAIHDRQVGGMQLYVTARDFKVIDNDLGNVRLNSNLEIAGELRAPRVEGDVSVSTGQVNVDEIVAVTGDSGYATEPTEYLAAPDRAEPPPSAATTAVDALRMDVRLIVPDDLIVKAISLQTPGSPVGIGAFTITMGGELRAMKEPGGRVRLIGAANTVRGFYDFQGRRFTILRDGTIRFDGTSELDPMLDVRAQRVIRAVTARVNVRGTLKKPEIILTSTPALEPADIMSLIVFNQPINLLGEGQQISLMERAQSLAASTATGALARSISDRLNLDEFSITLAPETGDDAQLTIGQQIGQNLYMKVEQGIGDDSQTNFVLEYELTDWLRLQTNVLQGSSTQQQLFQRMQGSGVDLLFFFSY